MGNEVKANETCVLQSMGPYETHDAAKGESDIVKEMLNRIQQERRLDGSSARQDR